MIPRQVAAAGTNAFRKTVRWLLEYRRAFIVLLHLGLIALASYAAIWLRFDGRIPEANWRPWVQAFPLLVVLRTLAFARFRLYQGLWRYTGVSDLRNIVSAVILSSLAHYLLVQWFFGLTGYPRAVFVMDAGVLILLMGGVRMLRPMIAELRHTSGERRVLVYGAGDAGAMIVREMRGNSSQQYQPIGLIDDDRAKVGMRIHGVPVLGTSQDLPAIFKKFRPHEVLIAIPRAEPAAIRSIVRSLEPFKVPIKTLPNLREIVDGRVDVEADSRPGHRGPACPRAGRPRPASAPSARRREAGDGHRRWRLDRVRAVPADCRPEAGEPGDARSVREHTPRHPPRARRPETLVSHHPGGRRRNGRGRA